MSAKLVFVIAESSRGMEYCRRWVQTQRITRLQQKSTF